MNVVLAIIVVTIISSFVDWTFFSTRIANQFAYQYRSKNMWRQPTEGVDAELTHQSRVGAQFVISLLFAVLFVILWSVFEPSLSGWVLGVLAWFAIVLPYMLFESVQLDLHPRYMAQLAIAWLSRLTFSGIAIGFLL